MPSCLATAVKLLGSMKSFVAHAEIAKRIIACRPVNSLSINLPSSSHSSFSPYPTPARKYPQIYANIRKYTQIYTTPPAIIQPPSHCVHKYLKSVRLFACVCVSHLLTYCVYSNLCVNNSFTTSASLFVSARV